MWMSLNNLPRWRWVTPTVLDEVGLVARPLGLRQFTATGATVEPQLVCMMPASREVVSRSPRH